MPEKRALTILIYQIILNTIFIAVVYAQPVSKPEKNVKKPHEYTIEQAISDEAQLHTAAFNGLAFLTGSYGADLFFPPGKTADYFGFQYMRDNDSNQLGHNTSFLSRIAENMLYILNDDQKEEFTKLARIQEKLYTDFAKKRFIIIKAFRQKLEGDTREFNKQAVLNTFESLYVSDAKLSYQRAEVLGKVINSFTDEQKKYIEKLSFLNSSTWPETDNRKEKKRNRLPHMQDVAVMTYASEMFSWYKGSISSDVYFCPERHGTYFGGFYLKDQPAMNNPGYSISTKLTGDSGKNFLKLLNNEQRNLLINKVNNRKNSLLKIVSIREDISKQLRKFITGDIPDESAVIELVKSYGRLDGELSISYAEAFAEINNTLSENQKLSLRELRGYDDLPEGGFLYSDPIDLPKDVDCEYLFQLPK